MGGSSEAESDGLGRERHGVDARALPARLCRDGATVRTAAGLCVWSGQGSLLFIAVRPADPCQTTPKLAKKARYSLDSTYSYLGGNAFGRDKKGRVTKDASTMSTAMAAAGHGGEGGEYSAYVCYEFEID